ncbi:unnamed protein product [Ostreobium quekettii]|uniref:Uncharacterized protein n=1 Tax=Ostreobium quekettii TaxID=121088 RepID=A0A8S1IYI0_9CHLO|nr:unnamed protein product [Ostreobium quekettii]|eukprot:evm.model.scf_146.2 EVM.evm.TU.scf_146.2   scf_146:76023-80031(-)
MRLGASGAALWIVLLGSWVHAAIALSDSVQDPFGAAQSRSLHSHDEGELTATEATQILLNAGVSNFGAILHRARSPTCHIDQLPASSVGQLFDLCVQIGHVNNCTAVAAPERREGTGAAVFRYRCRNDTCVDSWPPALTECMVGRLLRDAEVNVGEGSGANETGLQRTTQLSCDQSTMAAVAREEEMASRVGILESVGLSNAFHCLVGLPDGAVIDSNVSCADGRFRTDLILRLTEGGVLEEGEYECIWTGRCRDSKGCCERDQPFEGKFICYLPEGQQADLSSSASIPGPHWAPVLFLASCLASFWHLILSSAW